MYAPRCRGRELRKGIYHPPGKTLGDHLSRTYKVQKDKMVLDLNLHRSAASDGEVLLCRYFLACGCSLTILLLSSLWTKIARPTEILRALIRGTGELASANFREYFLKTAMMMRSNEWLGIRTLTYWTTVVAAAAQPSRTSRIVNRRNTPSFQKNVDHLSFSFGY